MSIKLYVAKQFGYEMAGRIHSAKFTDLFDLHIKGGQLGL